MGAQLGERGLFDTLSGLVLQQDEVLLMSGTVLQDCFYQFAVSEQRVTRNHLACELSAADAAFVFERSPESLRNFGNPVLCGLSWATLQLASSLSAATWGSWCRVALCSRGKLLVQASPPPCGLLSIGLVIDDDLIEVFGGRAGRCESASSLL